MKPIWDKEGHLTEFGTEVTAQFEKISLKFIEKLKPNGRETVELEAAMHKAVTFKTTMYRLSIQGLVPKKIVKKDRRNHDRS
jgi:hypothetical protein